MDESIGESQKGMSSVGRAFLTFSSSKKSDLLSVNDDTVVMSALVLILNCIRHSQDRWQVGFFVLDANGQRGQETYQCVLVGLW